MLSARKAAEALIKQKNEELFLANAEKDKFFSIIAHDLRSSFPCHLGLMEVIIHDKENLSMDEIVEFVTEIHKFGKNV
jgi:light-regulated signal transduction histidine kinase (bacteriophytochrome)